MGSIIEDELMRFKQYWNSHVMRTDWIINKPTARSPSACGTALTYLPGVFIKPWFCIIITGFPIYLVPGAV